MTTYETQINKPFSKAAAHQPFGIHRCTSFPANDKFVIQPKLNTKETNDRYEQEADKPAAQITGMANTRDNHLMLGKAAYQPRENISLNNISKKNRSESLTLQRDTFHSPSVGVRSPVLEEAATQLTEFEQARSLLKPERDLAMKIFGTAIDYSRVRLVPTSFLEYRTVGNSIRIAPDFTIAEQEMAQTFIHEMTHVWQYQHGGTSYMSISLETQIIAGATRKNRNFAYDYTIKSGQTFFDFTPEQQAFLVENYFSMLRDKDKIASGVAKDYNSNHMDPSGFPAQLTSQARLSEISLELPMHEPLIYQMRAALPRKAADLLLLRGSEVMQTPRLDIAPVPTERQLLPIKPLLEVTW